MKSNGVIFLKDWKLLVSSLSPENQIAFWDMFTNYEYGVEQICENEFVFPIWNFVKSQLDNMKDKYIEKVVNRNQQNGSKGGRPKKETQETQSEYNNPNNPMGLNETQKSHNNNNNEKDNNNDVLLEKEPKEINISDEAEIVSKKIPDEVKPEPEERKKVAQKKEKYFNKDDFKKKLLDLGVEEKHANDWIQIRKDKRASFTESAIDGVVRECQKHNYPFPDAIRNCAEKNWQGFKYEWLNENQKQNAKFNGNNQGTNNGFNNNSGNSTGSQSGKISARTILAQRLGAKTSGNNEGGNITVDVEVVE